MAKIIDGKRIALEKEQQLKEKVFEFVTKYHRHPKLVAIELSEDPASQLYLKLKRAAAERIGIEFQIVKRTVLDGQGQSLIGSDYRFVDGVFLQHPPHFDKKKWQEIADQIPQEKDVDCLTAANLQLIKSGKPRFLPATVKAIEYCLLEAISSSRGLARDPVTEGNDINIVSPASPAPRGELDSSTSLRSAQNDGLLKHFLYSREVVILGRSPMVGLPLSWYLESLGIKVILLGSDTKNISDFTKKADILISTTGRPGLISGDMIKRGAVIIDSGSPLGDVAFNEVAPKAFAITPVPGGVGPLTVVSLMENVLQSAYRAGLGKLLTYPAEAFGAGRFIPSQTEV